MVSCVGEALCCCNPEGRLTMVEASLKGVIGGAACAIGLLGAAPAFACDDADEDGPDVGLVLSGGGALLSTHIGAMQVIEEMGVPIHCVAGTSMGGVVAAMYAAGYDADQLAAIFSDERWNGIVRGQIPRRDKPYLQVEREEDYLTDGFAGIGEEGLRLPSGLSSMRGLRIFFREIMADVPPDLAFDDYEIPFRATGLDWASGDVVAFDQGDVVEVMLAAMAVPGVYAPREIDGRLYVDAGMGNQIPIDVIREMGADIIIAIDTTVVPSDPGAYPSIANTVQQLVQVAVWRNYRQQVALLGEGDLLIRPSIEGLSTSSFERAARGLASGVAEVRTHIAALEAIRDQAAPPTRAPMRRSSGAVDFAAIEIENGSALDDRVIRERLGFTDQLAIGDVTLRRRLNQLMAFGGLEEADLVATEDGGVLTVEERPIGRNLIQAGFRLSNDFNGNSRFSLLGRYARRPFSAYGGELNMSFSLGSTNGVEIALQQPFGPGGRYFVQPELFYAGVERKIDLGDFRFGEFWDQSGGARLRLGRELGAWGVIAVDAEAQIGRLSAQVTVLPDFEPLDYEQGGFGVLFAADTLDRPVWPTRGIEVTLRAQRLFEFGAAGTLTDKFDFSGLWVIDAGPLTVLASGRVAAVDNERNEPVELLNLGGFRQLAAYPQNAIPTDRFYYGSLEVVRRVNSARRAISIPVYVGLTAEYADAGFDFLGIEERSDLISIGGYLGIDTLVGPVILGGGFGEGGDRAFLLQVGTPF
jgi:NTE family protein